MALPVFNKLNDRFFIHRVIPSNLVFKSYECLDKRSHSSVICLIREFTEEDSLHDFCRNFMENTVCHPNLCSFIEAFPDNNNRSLVLVTEDKDGIPLTKYVARFHNQDNFKDGVVKMMKSLMDLVSHLDSCGQKFGKLTPDQVVIDVDPETKEYRNVFVRRIFLVDTSRSTVTFYKALQLRVQHQIFLDLASIAFYALSGGLDLVDCCSVIENENETLKYTFPLFTVESEEEYEFFQALMMEKNFTFDSVLKTKFMGGKKVQEEKNKTSSLFRRQLRGLPLDAFVQKDTPESVIKTDEDYVGKNPNIDNFKNEISQKLILKENIQNDSEDEFDFIGTKDDRESNASSWEAVFDERSEFSKSINEGDFQSVIEEDGSYEINDIYEVRTAVEEDEDEVKTAVEEEDDEITVDGEIEKFPKAIQPDYNILEILKSEKKQKVDLENEKSSFFSESRSTLDKSNNGICFCFCSSFGHKIPNLKTLFVFKPTLDRGNGTIEYGKNCLIFNRQNQIDKFTVVVNLNEDQDEIKNVVFEANCGRLQFNHISKVNDEVTFALSAISIAVYDALSKTVTLSIKNTGNVEGLNVQVFGNNSIKYIYKTSVLYVRNGVSVFLQTRTVPEVLLDNYGEITSEMLQTSFRDVKDVLRVRNLVSSKGVRVTFNP